MNGYQNKTHIFVAYKRPISDLETHTGWKQKDGKWYPCKWKSKEPRVAILISDMIHFKVKNIARDKKGFYKMINRSVRKEDTFLLFWAALRAEAWLPSYSPTSPGRSGFMLGRRVLFVWQPCHGRNLTFPHSRRNTSFAALVIKFLEIIALLRAQRTPVDGKQKFLPESEERSQKTWQRPCCAPGSVVNTGADFLISSSH